MTTSENDMQTNPGVLSGYRVLDFGWVLAGALPGMVLADMGAEVIKVETRQRLDYMRMGRPIVGDQPDPEQNPMFHNVNRGKLSVTLNIAEAEAVELARGLASRCDVVIENFSPGVMDRLGLGYEALRAVKPDIIMASISSTGQEGPLRDLRAYAPSIGSLSGLDSTMGYEGGGPLGLKHAFGDICGALHAVFAISSALFHRNRTGQGQYIDVSMLRATVVTQGVGLMEQALTGRSLQPRGNHDPTMAPYGNYPCAGEDKWVSIAVKSEAEWQSLVRAMGSPAWAADDRFSSQFRRQRHRRELDALLSRWTSQTRRGRDYGASAITRGRGGSRAERRGTALPPALHGTRTVQRHGAPRAGCRARVQSHVEPEQIPVTGASPCSLIGGTQPGSALRLPRVDR